MKSDLRTIANELESVYTDTEAYPPTAGFSTTGQVTTIATGVTTRTSKGNTFTYNLNGTSDAFCVVASNTKGNHPWVYVSSQGGLQASGANGNACPAAY
jgi:hypothetical protein